jgi:hypothetical protein
VRLSCKVNPQNRRLHGQLVVPAAGRDLTGRNRVGCPMSVQLQRSDRQKSADIVLRRADMQGRLQVS